MGMLSLAGIVSGAGAGAGKSLRQAQTYLNWEMLQEERGKLELARDERVNENNIARLQEARTFAASERAREKKEYYDPENYKLEAERTSEKSKFANLQWDSEADHRAKMQDELIALQKKVAGAQPGIALAALTGPDADKLKSFYRDKSIAEQQEVRDDLKANLQWYSEHKEVFELKNKIANMPLSEMDQFAFNKAKFEDSHRNQVYQATIDDKNINHLQLAANSIEKQIGVIEKALTGATDPGQIQSLSKRLRYLEKEDGLVVARIMKATGVKIEPFDMPVPAQDAGTKKTDGTRSTVSKHVGAAFDRRAKAVGEVADPVLDKAMEIVRRSGMFNLIPITGMVMDVPAATDE